MQNIVAKWSALSQVIADYYPYLAALLITLVIVTGLYCYWIRQKQKVNSQLIDIIFDLTHRMAKEQNLQETMDMLLDTCNSSIDAPGYFFYIYDSKGQEYILKAVRHSERNTAEIAPSYSGLVPYEQEKYRPPLSLYLDEELGISIVNDGKVPLLNFPLSGGKGLIRLGPFKDAIGKTKAILDHLEPLFSVALANSLRLEELRSQYELQKASSQAMQNLTGMGMDTQGTMSIIMNLSMQLIGCSGGMLLTGQAGHGKVMFSTSLPEQVISQLEQDQAGLQALAAILSYAEYLAISNTDQEFYQVPAYLAPFIKDVLLLLKVQTEKSQGVILYWYNDIPKIELHRFTALQMMTRRIGDLLDNHERSQELAQGYLNMLKILVQTADNLEPHSVGYSDLMARYSEIIAKELKMGAQAIQEVSQAAYLSNIGILGFSNQLLLKEGKYTEAEYETMKLHAKVSASIVESTLVDNRVALLIRPLHARMDGYGYPSGLKGEAIPIGSRIIAVVQTFLAKINGRAYREPLLYQDAMEMLKSFAGSQLDPAIVEALIRWFRKKQSEPARHARSLGPCWEMRCSPTVICQTCPAFHQPNANCWEVEGTKCAEHGNRCSSCLIYTEFAFRMGIKKKAGVEAVV